jgi:hypothetical protein
MVLQIVSNPVYFRSPKTGICNRPCSTVAVQDTFLFNSEDTQGHICVHMESKVAGTPFS